MHSLTQMPEDLSAIKFIISFSIIQCQQVLLQINMYNELSLKAYLATYESDADQ